MSPQIQAGGFFQGQPAGARELGSEDKDDASALAESINIEKKERMRLPTNSPNKLCTILLPNLPFGWLEHLGSGEKCFCGGLSRVSSNRGSLTR